MPWSPCCMLSVQHHACCPTTRLMHQNGAMRSYLQQAAAGALVVHAPAGDQPPPHLHPASLAHVLLQCGPHEEHALALLLVQGLGHAAKAGWLQCWGPGQAQEASWWHPSRRSEAPLRRLAGRSLQRSWQGQRAAPYLQSRSCISTLEQRRASRGFQGNDSAAAWRPSSAELADVPGLL